MINETTKWLESLANKLEEKTNEKITFIVGKCESEYYTKNENYIKIKGNLYMTLNQGNLFKIKDYEKNIIDTFDIFDSNAIVNIDEEKFTYIIPPYKISLNQIKNDIEYLNYQFIKFSGAWEHEDGDAYGCTPIAEQELNLVKNIASKYPFEYHYNPSEFDENSKYHSDEWYTKDIFTIDDFNKNNVTTANYGKVDAIAFDYQQELIGMLSKLKEELEWLPPRFRNKFLSEVICTCEQDRHSIQKNSEYFAEAITNELTKEEKSKMFVILG